MIKKYFDFFKQNFQFQEGISSTYDREARDYQSSYNKSHPNARIWRHGLRTQRYAFFRNGVSVSVEVEILRFVYAGTSRTFTFYGSLFSAFSCFSRDFIRQAVLQKNSPDSFPALTVSGDTLETWESLPGNRFQPRVPAPPPD